MSDDDNDVARQAQQHAGLERDEQQLPRPAEVECIGLGIVLLVLLGQWLASWAILLWWLCGIIIITCGHYASDREGGYEEDKQEDRVGDLGVGEQALSSWVRCPRQ